MKIIKPKALRKGDVIGIAAPASSPPSIEKLEKGIRYLERVGYRVEVGAHVNRRQGYLAGNDRERASDLHALFFNPNVKAIFMVRGGYGSMRILPLLDFPRIRRHPKIVLGYSDITALQLALFAKSGMVSFSGPMVSSEMADGLQGKSEEQFWECLTNTKPGGKIRIKGRKIYRKGTATGRIIGGNLSLVTAMVGTSFFPAGSDHILLLEELDERPYRVDRMMQQLYLGNVIKKTKGVVLGRFTNCEAEKGKPPLNLEEIFSDVSHRFKVPIVGHLNYGHVKNSLTMPLGIRVRLDTRGGTVELLESGVV